MQDVLNAVLCVVIPLAWGIVSARLLARLEGWQESRGSRSQSDSPSPPPSEIEYHI